MITRLTDLTLRCLDTSSVPDKVLQEFYTLLFTIGADLVEVNAEVARRLGNALIPSRTVLHLRHPSDAIPGFARYSCCMPDPGAGLHLVREVRVNDIREIGLLSRYQDEANLRIVGLDDLFLQDFRRAMDRLRRELPSSTELCPTNACGCASALLTEWLLKDGGNGVGAFAGAGGFAPLEEILLALRLTRKYQKRGDLRVLPRLTELYQQITGLCIPEYKAVLGRSIFAVESGIHVDGILKSANIYEPYPPELVGARRTITIGKHSGRSGILYVLKKLGCTPVEERTDALVLSVHRESVLLHRALTSDELLALAQKEGAI